MRPYSEDIRTRVIHAYREREGSQREIARRFDVSLGFVRNLLKRYRDTGSLAPKEHPGAVPKVDQSSLRVILHLVDTNPSVSLSFLCEQLAQEQQLRISRSTMWRIVRKYRPRRRRLLAGARNEQSRFMEVHQAPSSVAVQVPQSDRLALVSVSHSSETLATRAMS